MLYALVNTIQITLQKDSKQLILTGVKDDVHNNTAKAVENLQP